MPLPFIAYAAIAAGGSILIKLLKDVPELRKFFLEAGVQATGAILMVNEINALVDMDETAAMKHLDILVPNHAKSGEWDTFHKAFRSFNSLPDYPYERKVALNRLLTYAERVYDRTALEE